MSPKIKNIIIFVIIALAVVAIYIFFIKKNTNVAPLISSDSSSPVAVNSNINIQNSDPLTQDFLSLLLGVKSISLNDSIFQSGSSFFSLSDSSILLVPDGTEGRPNPFAPIGSDLITTPPLSNSSPTPLTIPSVVPPVSSVPAVSPAVPPTSITPVVPVVTTPPNGVNSTTPALTPPSSGVKATSTTN